METQEQRPYSGVRIIDLTRELGSYCTRLFADLGAEVIRVEPPRGRADRSRPPVPSGVDVATFGGIPHAFLNLNKKALRVDTGTDAGRAVFADLVGAAQVVVYEPGATEVPLADIVAIPGARVVASVSYFGLTGPYAGFVGCDLVAQALGGITWLSGEPGKPPLKLAGEQSVFVTSLYAAAATALALWDLEQSGNGHVLDVSAQEAIAHSLQNALQVYDLEGQVMSRGGEGVRDATEAAFACKDGYVFLAAPLSLSVSWNALLTWMKDEGFDGVTRLLEDDWKDRPIRATAAMKAEFRPLFERFVADKTKTELSAEALKRKLVMAPVSRIADLQADPQLLFRRFFHKVAMPGLGKDVA
ncbi:MAG TPA: CoA transferase, partial [Rhodopila sp.]|uniref:CoA transferase n=1 Tax=Rhodopila sp. TaxID=2480087 RepID=UPI002C60BC4B